MNSLTLRASAITTVALTFLLLVGCGSQNPAPPAETEATPISEGIEAENTSDHSHHGHHHSAPHGGALIVLPDDIGHLELVLDATTGTLTMYCLGSHAEEPVRITAESISLSVTTAAAAEVPVVLEAQANALTGETVGDTSVFRGSSPALTGADRFTGEIAALKFKGVDLSGILLEYAQGNE